MIRSAVRPAPELSTAQNETWDRALDQYRMAAAQTLHNHLRDGRQCVRCRQVWPCRRVLAAEFVLAL
jgi:hypothetical protein